MSNVNFSPSMLRLDTSRAGEYLYADRPKLSFGQKLGRFFGKAMGFLGPIGAAVTAIAVPGFGLPLAAGLYGLSKVSSDLTQNALAKDQQRMGEYNQEQAQKQIYIPGFGMGQMDSADIQTDFIAPSQFSAPIQDTLLNREAGVYNNIHTI